MTGGAEGRFKRAMDRLFSSSRTSTSSNTGQDKKDPSSAMSMPSKRAKDPSLSAHNALSETNLSPDSHHVCRPWDRKDLFRRLATFKSMSWFGKPEVAGPVNCARHGWVNVDVDLISCEGCNAMLSFPCPPAWSQHEAESAAATFAEKLETGHKALCPWKENACSDSLVQFPPTPIEALVEAFNDRCDALNQLSSLPVISSYAVDGMKSSKGLQMEHFMTQAALDTVIANGATTDGSQRLAAWCTFHQVQRIISLCGWELRLLPYVVDYEGENTDSIKESPRSDHQRCVDAGPKVLLYPLEGERNASRRFDVCSAVLDCSLCSANVGLWPFSVVPRPSSSIRHEPLTVDTAHTAGQFSAASGIHKESCDNRTGIKKIETCFAATSGLTTIASAAASVLSLKLTIAGGPRPTQLNLLKSQLSSADKSNEEMKPSQDEPSGHAVGEEDRHDIVGRKRRWQEGSGLDEREILEHKVRVLPCQSSVDAVDTCYNRPENSAESVEMPPRNKQKAACSRDNTGSSRDVGMLTSDTVLGGGLGRTTLPLSKIMAYDRPVKAAVEASPVQEKRSDFRVLVDESSRVFDPIMQHRHFCPWVNANVGTGLCGWQVTLDALEASPAVEQSESVSSIHNADPLSSVRRIFGR